MTDKNVLRQVIGGLMQRPHLLSEVDKYSLTVSDFSSRFEKYIFSAITNLYCKGATKSYNQAFHIFPCDFAFVF